MKVGEIINLTKDENITTACIVSLLHAVIVKIDRTKGIEVTHTPALELFGTKKAGMIALIRTLSPHSSRLDTQSFPPAILPNEIFETIFRYLTLISDNAMEDIASFAQTCKLFSAIVHDRTVCLPGRVFLTFPSENDNLFWAIDDGWRGVCHFLGHYYQGGASEYHRDRCWIA